MAGKIKDVVVVSITRDTFVASQVGFGTGIMLVETTAMVDRVGTYSEVSEMTSDGFGDQEVAYLAANTHFSQQYSPENLKIARKGTADKNCVQLVVMSAAATSGTFTLTLDGQTTTALEWDDITTANKAAIETAIEALSNVEADGVTVTVKTDYKEFYIEFDNDNANTPFELVSVTSSLLATATAVTGAAQFSYHVEFDAASTAGVYTITVNGETTVSLAHGTLVTASKYLVEQAIEGLASMYSDGVEIDIEADNESFYISFVNSNYGKTISSLTVDVSALTSVTTATVKAAEQGQANETWSAAYAAMAAADDDWFALMTPGLQEASDRTNQAALAALIEAEDAKIYGITTVDPIVKTSAYDASVPTDIAADMKALTRTKTFVLFSGNSGEYVAEALLGRQLPLTPGSSSYTYKILSGITAASLTTSEKAVLESKNANYFQAIAGANRTFLGKVGSGEWIDVIVGVDFLKTRISEAVFTYLATEEKPSYDGPGLSAIGGIVRSALTTYGVLTNLLVAGTVSVTLPLIEDVTIADKAARTLRNVKFGGVLKGSIVKAYLDGKLSL